MGMKTENLIPSRRSCFMMAEHNPVIVVFDDVCLNDVFIDRKLCSQLMALSNPLSVVRFCLQNHPTNFERFVFQDLLLDVRFCLSCVHFVLTVFNSMDQS